MGLTINVAVVPIIEFAFTDLTVIMGGDWRSVGADVWSVSVVIEELVAGHLGKFLFFEGGVGLKIILN